VARPPGAVLDGRKTGRPRGQVTVTTSAADADSNRTETAAAGPAE
jgi:hypothetical protein